MSMAFSVKEATVAVGSIRQEQTQVPNENPGGTLGWNTGCKVSLENQGY